MNEPQKDGSWGLMGNRMSLLWTHRAPKLLLRNSTPCPAEQVNSLSNVAFLPTHVVLIRVLMTFPNFPFPVGSSRNPSTGDAVIAPLSATLAQAKPQVPQSGLLLLKHSIQHKGWLSLFSLYVWIPAVS